MLSAVKQPIVFLKLSYSFQRHFVAGAAPLICAAYLFAALTTFGYAGEPHFTNLTTADAIALLPPPPASGSAQATAEIEAVMRARNACTEAGLARLKSEGKLSPAVFQS